MIYLQLFFEFFKTGLFAVGGGLATIPFLNDMAVRTGWFTQHQLADMIAVAESTPGPIGVNTATYVGYTTAGIPGGIIATLGLVAPSVIIVVIVAMFLRSFADNRFVKSVFRFLRAASLGLVSAAGISLAKTALLSSGNETAVGNILSRINPKAVFLAVVLLALTQFIPQTKKWHPIIWIGLSAVAGILLF